MDFNIIWLKHLQGYESIFDNLLGKSLQVPINVLRWKGVNLIFIFFKYMNNKHIFCPRFNYVIEFNWKTNQNIDKHATSPKKEDEWGPYLYTDLYIYGKYIVIKRSGWTDTILFRKICEIGDHSRQWIFKKQWRSHFFNPTHTHKCWKKSHQMIFA